MWQGLASFGDPIISSLKIRDHANLVFMCEENSTLTYNCVVNVVEVTLISDLKLNTCYI
jgi:hypothetical protein